MKPRVTYADIFGRDLWLEQFNRLKDLPEGTKLYAGTRKFRLAHVYGADADDPHPKSLELAELQGHESGEYMLRRGDSLIFELQTEPVEVIT